MMEFIDARRLTGPNVIFDGVGSILDVACSPEEGESLVPVWADNVGRMLEALDWPSAEFAFVNLQGGISLAFSAPSVSRRKSRISMQRWPRLDSPLRTKPT
jgi:hypothetical protein